MHQHGPVGLEHQHPGRHRQVGREAAGVVDLAAGNDESHGAAIYPLPRVTYPTATRPPPRGKMPGMSSSERDFTTIGVVGLGTMGAGIAEVFARNGFSVVGVEINDDAVARGRQHLEHSTGRAVKRGKLSEDEQKELLDRVTFSTSMEDLEGRRLRGRGRRGVARDQEGDLPRARRGIVSPDAILATNTSSLSVTEISTANSRPGRVIGVHFFNPAPVQDLVEIVRTVVTEPEVLERRQGPRRAGWARTRSSAATRPASSPTRCCSATSTTRSRCTRAATPPARTSTPPCASAAATRWARWRCST